MVPGLGSLVTAARRPGDRPETVRWPARTDGRRSHRGVSVRRASCPPCESAASMSICRGHPCPRGGGPLWGQGAAGSPPAPPLSRAGHPCPVARPGVRSREYRGSRPWLGHALYSLRSASMPRESPSLGLSTRSVGAVRASHRSTSLGTAGVPACFGGRLAAGQNYRGFAADRRP